jgi:hypothetical protein
MSNSPTAAPPGPQTPAEFLLQMATGYMVSSALQVVTKLEVADQLAGGPRAVEEIADAVGADADALYRVMRALASIGIFEPLPDRRFSLNQHSELLRKDIPGPRPLILWMTDPFHFNVYADTLHSVVTGKPAVEKTVGMGVFEYFPKNPELWKVFNDAMTTMSAMVIPAALETYDFSDAGIVVDVAGGHGHVLMSILQKHPGLQGILFDLEQVVEGAKPRIEAAGLAGRLRTVGGDFFKGVPPGDTYVMKHIIHDWDDDRAIQLLGNIRTAMRDKARGRVVLLESVLAPPNVPELGKLIDLEMLLMAGGRERTAEEFRALFDKAGFELTRIVPNKSPLSAVESRVKS